MTDVSLVSRDGRRLPGDLVWRTRRLTGWRYWLARLLRRATEVRYPVAHFCGPIPPGDWGLSVSWTEV